MLRQLILMTAAVFLGVPLVVLAAPHLESRHAVSYLRGRYNTAFFWRENETFRNGAAIHFAHGKAHDVLQLADCENYAAIDEAFSKEMVDSVLNHRAATERRLTAGFQRSR